ncbi:MAG: hypothetical protein IKO41_06375 [Lachnospiraceae bacterium]|nr:hypothetical protein [Lachnospiraceae bacterium]
MVEQWIIDCIDAGVRTNKLEGLEYSDEELKFIEKMKTGEISLEEAEKIYLEKIAKKMELLNG